MKQLRQFYTTLTHPIVMTLLIPWLMVLLVVGTVAQRYIGLYEAEQLFFASWVVWFGPFPLPGIYPTLAVLSLALCAKLMSKSPWRKPLVGSIITHMGALLLLVGGMLSALTAEEGFMTLRTGEPVSAVSDYHQREFVIFKNDEPLLRLPHATLQDGLVLTRQLPFTLTINLYCRHCEPMMQQEPQVFHRGIADKIALHDAPLQTEDEANQAGIVFTIEGVDDVQDGQYLVYEPTPHQPELMVGKDSYRIATRKVPRPLPFSVTLEAFDKFVHPGTDTAREYQSRVTIDEGNGMRWQKLIRMNEPLRVRGYTLYQSSFIDARGELLSVLAVVKNDGRVFPYIASIVMGLGMLIHLVVRRRHADA